MTTALSETKAGHRPVDSKKAKLLGDLQGVVADADALLREVANAGADEFGALGASIEQRLDDARLRLDEARHAVVHKTRHAAAATQEFVVDNPWTVLGVAAAAGVVIGALLSRR
ncbi:DUF883 family protein [Rhodocyclus tenuis]|nr:DUF883 family protein [Rhodocyclus gracilis]NJA87948.1 DUF883 family protein [Rhodocyclus gracilis]